MADFKVGDRVMLNSNGAAFVRMIDDMDPNGFWRGWSGVLTYGSCATITESTNSLVPGAPTTIFLIVFDAGPDLLFYPSAFIKAEETPVAPRPAGPRVMLNREGHNKLRFLEAWMNAFHARSPRAPRIVRAIPQYFGDTGTALGYNDDSGVEVLFDNDTRPCHVNVAWVDLVTDVVLGTGE